MLKINWEIVKTFSFLSEEELEIVNWLLSDKVAQNHWPSIAVYLEQQQEITIISPLCLTHLKNVFEEAKTELDQEVYLRILLIIGKQLGRLWTVFRIKKQPIIHSIDNFINSLNQKQEINNEEDFFYLWSYTMELYQLFLNLLYDFSADSLIVKGINQEVKTIVDMLQQQDRIVFAKETIWLSHSLKFRMIQKGDESLLETNLTSNVGKYLSIDGFSHPLLTQEYIKQSVLEMTYGTCLVLMAFDLKTNDFIGSCTLNDINKETSEIGLWIKESEQHKGFGTEIMDKLLQIVKENKLSKNILYTVEDDNKASIALCNKFSFVETDQFILEPNPLKNKYREMIQFTYKITSLEE